MSRELASPYREYANPHKENFYGVMMNVKKPGQG
jgi:hypothetical protein